MKESPPGRWAFFRYWISALKGKHGDEGAAAAGIVPIDSEMVAAIGAPCGHSGHRVAQVRRERWIVDFFIVAEMVGVSDRARGKPDQISGRASPSGSFDLERGGAVEVSLVHCKANGRRLDRDNVPQQAAGLRLRKAEQR